MVQFGKMKTGNFRRYWMSPSTIKTRVRESCPQMLEGKARKIPNRTDFAQKNIPISVSPLMNGVFSCGWFGIFGFLGHGVPDPLAELCPARDTTQMFAEATQKRNRPMPPHRPPASRTGRNPEPEKHKSKICKVQIRDLAWLD